MAEKYFTEKDCQTISIPNEFIPEKAELIEAYRTKTEFIILGDPEDIKEHNCDEMGCGTLTHVIFRIPIQKRAEVK